MSLTVTKLTNHIHILNGLSFHHVSLTLALSHFKFHFRHFNPTEIVSIMIDVVKMGFIAKQLFIKGLS